MQKYLLDQRLTFCKADEQLHEWPGWTVYTRQEEMAARTKAQTPVITCLTSTLKVLSCFRALQLCKQTEITNLGDRCLESASTAVLSAQFNVSPAKYHTEDLTILKEICP